MQRQQTVVTQDTNLIVQINLLYFNFVSLMNTTYTTIFIMKIIIMYQVFKIYFST